MSAPHAPRFLCACAVIFFTLLIPLSTASSEVHDDLQKTIELFDGVKVKIPESNSTEKLVSFEFDTDKDVIEGRGKSKGSKKLMQRILPMFIMPFLIQSTIVPFFLSMLKFMLFKSMMVGKLALALILFNAFKNHNTVKGRDAQVADVHYGYNGNPMEGYGAYFN